MFHYYCYYLAQESHSYVNRAQTRCSQRNMQKKSAQKREFPHSKVQYVRRHTREKERRKDGVNFTFVAAISPALLFLPFLLRLQLPLDFIYSVVFALFVFAVAAERETRRLARNRRLSQNYESANKQSKREKDAKKRIKRLSSLMFSLFPFPLGSHDDLLTHICLPIDGGRKSNNNAGQSTCRSLLCTPFDGSQMKRKHI